MSAFIVSEACMDRCINVIADQFMHDNARTFGSLILDDPEDLTTLGQQLFKLNQQAIHARYGGPGTPNHNDDYAAVPDFKMKWQVITLVDGVKALQCLLYQCSEGDIPETSLLYANLDKAVLAIQSRIVSALPEYEKAAWC